MNKPIPKQIAITAAKAAGTELIKHFSRVTRSVIRTKSKHEIVTPADLAAERIILSAIKKNFPEHRILSEESGYNKNKSDYLWIIDPLGGTTNFAMGNPLFSVSIALAHKNEIILGLVNAPYLKETYLTLKNQGAYLNGKKIHVSSEKEIKKSIITYCHGYDVKSIKRAIKIYGRLKFVARDARQIGSAAIESAWVAMGRIEALVLPGVNAWDVAAGALLIREAGGIVTDMHGKTWTIQSKGILASNKNIHPTLLKTIKKIK